MLFRSVSQSRYLVLYKLHIVRLKSGFSLFQNLLLRLYYLIMNDLILKPDTFVSGVWADVYRYDGVFLGRVLVDARSGLKIVVGYAPVAGVTDSDLASLCFFYKCIT